MCLIDFEYISLTSAFQNVGYIVRNTSGEGDIDHYEGLVGVLGVREVENAPVRR